MLIMFQFHNYNCDTDRSLHLHIFAYSQKGRRELGMMNWLHFNQFIIASSVLPFL